MKLFVEQRVKERSKNSIENSPIRTRRAECLFVVDARDQKRKYYLEETKTCLFLAIENNNNKWMIVVLLLCTNVLVASCQWARTRGVFFFDQFTSLYGDCETFSQLVRVQIMNCVKSQVKYFLQNTPRRTKEREGSNARAIRDTGIRQDKGAAPCYSTFPSHCTSASQLNRSVLFCLFLLCCECRYVRCASASLLPLRAEQHDAKGWFSNNHPLDAEAWNVPEEKSAFQRFHLMPQRLIG